jgi:inosose dehydratase
MVFFLSSLFQAKFRRVNLVSTLKLSRRGFVLGLGSTALATGFAATAMAETIGPLTNLRQPPKRELGNIKFGYAAITWEGNDVQAMKDISDLSFPGIQLRSNVLKEYEAKPEALKALLNQYKLELVAFSSGGVNIASGTEADEIAKHVRNAKFVRALNGHYLQVTDSARPKDRKPEPADFKRLSRVLTEIGKRTADLGLPLGYHNHMGSLGEAPDEVDRIMAAVDPRYVKLELDIAHYKQGGGDPAKAIRQYRDRLLFLHIKDVESLASAEPAARKYRFVELGRGNVNLPEVFAALDEVKFEGWAVVELDSVPDKSRTPKESAQISKEYLEKKLGATVCPCD